MTEPCKTCLILYGMENPPKKTVGSNRNFLLILDEMPDGEKRILIIPKTHCSSLVEMVDEKDAREDFNEIVEKAFNYIRKEIGATDLTIRRIAAGGHDYLVLAIRKQ